MKSLSGLMRKVNFGIYAASQKKVEANWGHFIRWALGLLILLALIQGVCRNVFHFSPTPYTTFELWTTKGTVGQWLVASWPILAWGGGLTLLVSALTRNSRRENQEAESFAVSGLWLSLRAGVMEEVIFRWLLFMLFMISAPIADYILGGFIFNHGLVWAVNEWVLLPLANWVTFGMLSDVLMNREGWVVATALLMANARFRDGHKYQGLFGIINSWVIGMFMFALLFKFGLIACIVVHFAYDALLYLIRYADRLQERARGVHGAADMDE